jgi:hypothetical protein
MCSRLGELLAPPPAADEAERANRSRRVGVAGLWAFMVINVVRHVPNLHSGMVTHFGRISKPVSWTGGDDVENMPTWIFVPAVICCAATQALAVVVVADRAFAIAAVGKHEQPPQHQQGHVQGRVRRAAAHAVFAIGVVSLLCADLTVWALLEANEDEPQASARRLPAADSCVPCRLFIPYYLTFCAGARWFVLSAVLGLGVVLCFALPRCIFGRAVEKGTEAEKESLVRASTLFEEL